MEKHIDIQDFIWFSIIALAILAFGSIPYWAANSAATDELLFRGAYFDKLDYSVHTSMMQAGRMGSWAYELRFTSEKQSPVFIRMFYLVLGHISKWINLGIETTYHAARWILGFIALYTLYQLCQKFFQEKKLARLAFVLCAIGGGAAWLQFMFNPAALTTNPPIDLWLIDAYVFFSISLFPAFSFTLILMITTVILYLDYLMTDKWWNIILISLLAVISQTTNPIAFATIDIVLAISTALLWWKNGAVKLNQFYALVIIAVVQIPLLIYNFLILVRDPVWSQFTLQNETLSPAPSYYIWGFAPFWLFAIYGIVLAIRNKNINMLAMATWVLSGFILAYLPLSIQRRFLLGITIPLGILAIYGLDRLMKLVSIKLPALSKRQGLIYFTYILFASFSFVYMSIGSSLYLQTRPGDNFYPRDLENAFIWLDKNAAPNDIILGDIRTGLLVAQRTRLRTYAGHPMETLFYDDKIVEIKDFYQGKLPNNWILEKPIQWVIYGLYERDLSPSFQPDTDLEVAYKNNTVIVYKVNH